MRACITTTRGCAFFFWLGRQRHQFVICCPPPAVRVCPAAATRQSNLTENRCLDPWEDLPCLTKLLDERDCIRPAGENEVLSRKGALNVGGSSWRPLEREIGMSDSDSDEDVRAPRPPPPPPRSSLPRVRPRESGGSGPRARPRGLCALARTWLTN